jgi:hypothetical protein
VNGETFVVLKVEQPIFNLAFSKQEIISRVSGMEKHGNAIAALAYPQLFFIPGRFRGRSSI